MEKSTNNINLYKAALFGVAVGDALGVPVEFSSRSERQSNPVTEMIGYGTYNQPPGTWSDDSSMTFCLAEALTKPFDLNIIAQNFVAWIDEGYWTAHNEVFDVGIATYEAISYLRKGVRPEMSGGAGELSNGNGSLMRILPLIFYIKDKPLKERFEIIRDVSSITHRHIRSVVACFYYLEFTRHLLDGLDKWQAYQQLQRDLPEQLLHLDVSSDEIRRLSRLLKDDISTLTADDIESSGYVLHTLEASIWCLLTTDSYYDAVLLAVNLGRDTDTTGAVCGGIAALAYGFDAIPNEWIDVIARKADIEDLANRMMQRQITRCGF